MLSFLFINTPGYFVFPKNISTFVMKVHGDALHFFR